MQYILLTYIYTHVNLKQVITFIARYLQYFETPSLMAFKGRPATLEEKQIN